MLLLLLLRPASAFTLFPGWIFEHLDLAEEGLNAPPCTICHLDNRGKRGTVVKPFGIWMYDHGLRGDATEEELGHLLDENEQKGIDSDLDGVGDIAELRDGTDPNIAGNTLSPPQYGCLSTTSRTTPAPLLALDALGLVARRRRR
jgi:hypothetical protein